MTIVQIDDDEFFDIQNFHEDKFISLKKFMNKRKIKDYSDLESHTHGNRDTLSEVFRNLTKKEKQKEKKRKQKNDKVSQPQTSEENQENEH